MVGAVVSTGVVTEDRSIGRAQMAHRRSRYPGPPENREVRTNPLQPDAAPAGTGTGCTASSPLVYGDDRVEQVRERPQRARRATAFRL